MYYRTLRNILFVLFFFSFVVVAVKAEKKSSEKTKVIKVALVNDGSQKDKKKKDKKQDKLDNKQVINISLFTVNNIGEKKKEEKKEPIIVSKEDFEITSLYDLLQQTRKWWDEVLKWFGRQQTNIMVLFAGLLLTMLIATFFGWVFKKIVIGIFARKTKNELDDKVCDSLKRPLVFLIFSVGAFLSSIKLLHELDEEVFNIVFRLFVASMASAVVWGIYRLVEVFNFYLKRLAQRSDNNLDDLLAELICKALRFTVVFVAVLFIGQTILGLQITALVAGAGIAGLAIALAAKDTLANFFGSVMIMIDKPFTVGERITVDSYDGVVEKIGFRSTRIRSLTGHMYSIPNNKLADSAVENIAKRPYIKYAFGLTLVYDTAPEQMERAIEILHEILDGHEGFDDNLPPRIYFTDFQDWALNISIILWFQSTDYFHVQQWKHDINLEILRRFNAEGLDFAFPTSTNYLVGDSSRELKVITAEDKK